MSTHGNVFHEKLREVFVLIFSFLQRFSLSYWELSGSAYLHIQASSKPCKAGAEAVLLLGLGCDSPRFPRHRMPFLHHLQLFSHLLPWLQHAQKMNFSLSLCCMKGNSPSGVRMDGGSSRAEPTLMQDLLPHSKGGANTRVMKSQSGN